MTGLSSQHNQTTEKPVSGNRHYQNLKNSIRALYPEGISEKEADEATRNFIGFGKLMLEIKRQRGLDAEDE